MIVLQLVECRVIGCACLVENVLIACVVRCPSYRSDLLPVASLHFRHFCDVYLTTYFCVTYHPNSWWLFVWRIFLFTASSAKERRLYFDLRLFVRLCVCRLNYSKSYARILTKFFWMGGTCPGEQSR